MTEKYRKLTQTEARMYLEALANDEGGNKFAIFAKFARDFYPDGQVAFLSIEYASEYNDSTYDNEVRYVSALDRQGNEIAPIAAKAKAARKAMTGLPMLASGETDEPLDRDSVIPLIDAQDLYVKE